MHARAHTAQGRAEIWVVEHALQIARPVKLMLVAGSSARASSSQTHLRGVDKIAYDTNCFVVYKHVLRSQHVDQSWQRPTLYDLVLVVLILESQCPQCASSCSLDLVVVCFLCPGIAKAHS